MSARVTRPYRALALPCHVRWVGSARFARFTLALPSMSTVWAPLASLAPPSMSTAWAPLASLAPPPFADRCHVLPHPKNRKCEKRPRRVKFCNARNLCKRHLQPERPTPIYPLGALGLNCPRDIFVVLRAFCACCVFMLQKRLRQSKLVARSLLKFGGVASVKVALQPNPSRAKGHGLREWQFRPEIRQYVRNCPMGRASGLYMRYHAFAALPPNRSGAGCCGTGVEAPGGDTDAMAANDGESLLSPVDHVGPNLVILPRGGRASAREQFCRGSGASRPVGHHVLEMLPKACVCALIPPGVI